VVAATNPSTGTAAVVEPATRLVDLNTASIEELNTLQDGGMIGRAIVRGRPYTSVEDLLAKRVLNRATYQRVVNQITIR
jgi:DNA uptake protein ComE-like DNA-binding protein